MHSRLFKFALVLTLLGAGVANADPILVQPDSSTSSATITINSSACASFAPCTATPDMASNLGSVGMMMDVGSTWTFDFFDIVVNGLGLVTNATVSATLGFQSPVNTSNATGSGAFGTFFGAISGGWLHWNDASDIAVGDGTWLSVDFSDLLELGLGNSATVTATVTRYGEVASVPEPSTLALFGLGLMGIGFGARRKQHS